MQFNYIYLSNVYSNESDEYFTYPVPSCSKRRKLNELVKGHFVNCFSGFNIQYSVILAEKMWVAFA